MAAKEGEGRSRTEQREGQAKSRPTAGGPGQNRKTKIEHQNKRDLSEVASRDGVPRRPGTGVSRASRDASGRLVAALRRLSGVSSWRTPPRAFRGPPRAETCPDHGPQGAQRQDTNETVHSPGGGDAALHPDRERAGPPAGRPEGACWRASATAVRREREGMRRDRRRDRYDPEDDQPGASPSDIIEGTPTAPRCARRRPSRRTHNARPGPAGTTPRGTAAAVRRTVSLRVTNATPVASGWRERLLAPVSDCPRRGFLMVAASAPPRWRRHAAPPASGPRAANRAPVSLWVPIAEGSVAGAPGGVVRGFDAVDVVPDAPHECGEGGALLAHERAHRVGVATARYKDAAHDPLTLDQ